MSASCMLTSWFTFLVGIGAGAVLLAIILHYVDKAMSK